MDNRAAEQVARVAVRGDKAKPSALQVFFFFLGNVKKYLQYYH